MKRNQRERRGRGLGRGLDALFMDGEDESSSTTISVESLRPNALQPRRTFDEEELDALTDSIRRNGVLTPVLVRPLEAGGYELIAGERRWRAAKRAGLATIPAVIRQVSDAEALTFAIIENEQRDDLTPIESAYAYQQLIDRFGYSQQQVADALGVSRSQVSNLLRLQQLPERIRNLIEHRRLTMGQARPLIGLPEELAESLCAQCIEQGWSARRMEQEVKRAQQKKKPTPTGRDPEREQRLAEEIARHTGLAAQVRWNRSGGGRITIPFSHPGELEPLLQRLRKGGEG